MSSFLRPRRGKQSTAASTLTASNPLKRGEIFFEVPTGGVGTGTGKLKMGDGSTAYANLPYFLSMDDSVVTFTDSSASSSWDNYSNYLANIKTGITLPTFFANTKNLLYQLCSKVTSLNNDLEYQDTKGTTYHVNFKTLKNMQSNTTDGVNLKNRWITFAASGNMYHTTAEELFMDDWVCRSFTDKTVAGKEYIFDHDFFDKHLLVFMDDYSYIIYLPGDKETSGEIWVRPLQGNLATVKGTSNSVTIDNVTVRRIHTTYSLEGKSYQTTRIGILYTRSMTVSIMGY